MNPEDPTAAPQASAPEPAASPAEAAPIEPPTPAAAPPEPDFLDRFPWWGIPAVLLGVPAIVTALALYNPPQFYDNFVWKYYWGPIWADAANYAQACLRPDGTLMGQSLGAACSGVAAQSGYNVVNTASWALLLGICVVGVGKMLRRFNTPMGGRLILGASAWVLVGSLWHTLEDTALIRPALEYFFITPPIYLMFAAFGILAFLDGQYLKRVAERAGLEPALQKLWFHHVLLVVLYLLLWISAWDQFTVYVNPVWVALIAVVSFLVQAGRARRRNLIDPTDLVLTASLGPFLLAVAFMASYLSEPWSNHAETRWWALWAPVIAGAAVIAVASVVRRSKNLTVRGMGVPVLLGIVFAQVLDGVATTLGIDFAGYNEKHVLSAGVIDWTRGFFRGDYAFSVPWQFGAEHPSLLGFLPLKFALAIAVAGLFSSEARKQGQSATNQLTGLFQFAIIMVGLGPGVRDFTRLWLGV